MSIWLVLPSKRPPEQADPVLRKWQAMGYRVMIQRDPGENFPAAGVVSHVRPYLGYAEAINFLAREALEHDSSCDWIVAAGDDTDPDLSKRAYEIAAECSAHFRAGTFGVMQPTGDRWGEGLYPDAHEFVQRADGSPRCHICGAHDGGRNHCWGAMIDRIAGSPWLGREWCLRANQGKGPLWPGFFHMWADEALQIVAQKLGVFWQRPDLTHHHEHWGRPRPGERIGQMSRMPAFLAKANSAEQTTLDKAEFDRLKADDFKECLPL